MPNTPQLVGSVQITFFVSKQGVIFVTYVWFKLRTCVQHKTKFNYNEVNLP